MEDSATLQWLDQGYGRQGTGGLDSDVVGSRVRPYCIRLEGSPQVSSGYQAKVVSRSRALWSHPPSAAEASYVLWKNASSTRLGMEALRTAT